MAKESPMTFPAALRTLTDVTIDEGTLAQGDVVAYDGIGFANTPPAPVIDKLTDLSDVDIDPGAVQYGDQIYYDGNNFASRPATMQGLSDVAISSLQTNDYLTYNGNYFVNQPAPSTISQLDDIADVSAASPANNDRLVWNGTQWATAQPRPPYRRRSMVADAGGLYVVNMADPIEHLELDMAAAMDYLSNPVEMADFTDIYRVTVEYDGQAAAGKSWSYRLSMSAGSNLQYLSAIEETITTNNKMLDWPLPGGGTTSSNHRIWVPPLAPNILGDWTVPQVALATSPDLD